MEDCLFCMIAEGKIPSNKLYEDDQVVAFYDINPQAKVHFLVVPKKHIQSAAALTEEDGALLGHIFAMIAKLAKEVGGVKIASAYFTGTSGDTLRGMCDSIRDKAVNPCVAVLVGKTDDKITMAVTVNKLAQEKGLKAGNLVKEISAIAGGKGGGKPDFAMAGLKEETKIDEALAAVKGIVEKQLG